MLSLWKLIFWFFLVPLISFKSVFEARLVKEAYSDAFCLCLFPLLFRLQEQKKSSKLEESMKMLDYEMKKTDDLLYRMIPKPVAKRLRKGEPAVNTCEVRCHFYLLAPRFCLRVMSGNL